MRKILFAILFFIAGLVYGQINYGIKAGLNYNANEDLNITGGFLPFNTNFSSEAKIGFTVGVYGNIELGKFYVQPEFLFSQTTSSYNDNPDFTLSFIDIPVLTGFNVIKNLSFYAGPSIQFILDNEFSSAFDLSLDNKTSFAINLGTSLKLGKFGIDARYFKGVSKNLASYNGLALDGPLYELETKPSQVVLSLSYRLN